MAKRDHDLPPAEEYIEQLQWQSRHRRRYWPVRYEPKWKYKIVYRSLPASPLAKALSILFAIGVIGFIIYFLASDYFTEQVGAKIFFGIVFGLILIIIFFAVCDASNDKEDNT
jgi:hypothetical protein